VNAEEPLEEDGIVKIINMETIIIILSILLFIAVAFGVLVATKVLKDRDGDGIADVLEDKFQELKSEIKSLKNKK
jgi:hypothetical protein